MGCIICKGGLREREKIFAEQSICRSKLDGAASNIIKVLTYKVGPSIFKVNVISENIIPSEKPCIIQTNTNDNDCKQPGKIIPSV
ncbi:hypothetical protein SteCoe_16909 [Stentor coeruleus]|uniref:Uncharacterized protein n=1 Tax=Stentor coeruleus TaxID=5963 RepID=A0A1R2C084_9CILI|nr:hypothetical protein SteCoe_16909 [Stentor coeruleus]